MTKEITIAFGPWSFWLERKSGEERQLVAVELISGYDDLYLVTAEGEISGKVIQLKMWDAHKGREELAASAARLILDNEKKTDEGNDER